MTTRAKPRVTQIKQQLQLTDHALIHEVEWS
jgi:hypothetical protein